jgi:hypothetical protein
MIDLASLWYVGVPLIGAAVGATELIARYKDAPFIAINTGPARWYIFVNALAALFAYVLIVNFDFKFGATTEVGLVQALVASFGSMAFFRSSLFSMKVGETDVAVGPAIFFQVLLFATDRACDRERAEPRSADVSHIMQGVFFELARDALPNFCFELMQNIPASEQQQFRLVVDALASSTKMRDSVKVLNLGLMLMNVVGQQVLEAAVRTLGEKIQGPARLELEVFTALQRADFSKAYPLLIDIAFIMSKYGTRDEQAAAKNIVLEEIKPLTARPDLDNGSKMTQLGLSLQQKVGDTVLLAALAHIASGIQLQQRSPEVAEPEAPAPVPPADAAHEPTTNVTPIRPDIDPAATAIAAGNAVANAASDAADAAAGAKKEEGG